MDMVSQEQIIGIDVSRDCLDVHCLPDGSRLRIANTAQGHEQLAEIAHDRRALVCFEATGGQEWRLWAALDAAGIEARQLPPAQIKAFATSRGTRAKTDRIDALALCQRLDRYVRGNRKAFSVVRVPSEEEERERAFSRQRQQLVRERQRLQAMGRSLLAMQGIHVRGKWWKGQTWAAICREAPAWVVERLEVFMKLIEPVEVEERKLTEGIQKVGRKSRIPKGVGPLSFEVLRREVGDWSRFNNRREVSSYTGLCPREHSSGGKRRGGSVNKSGNPRVRAMLVEMVWRMMRWQPGYHALRKWMAVLGDASRSAAVRKKAIVAVARQLAVDLWRLFTGQTTAEKLGLIYLPEAS